MTVDDINKYMQWWAINNNLFTVSQTGDYVYYIEMDYNISTYSVNVIVFPLALPSGGTNPNNMYLDGTRTMQIVISPSNKNFGLLLGLSEGTYPPSKISNAPVTINSNITVEGSPINAIVLTSNLVDNSISVTPEAFYMFTPNNTSFGSNIVQSSPELIWIQAHSGRFSQVVFELKDQLGRPIECRDSSIAIQICIKSE
jgi:hypothetical protein